jgi:hypothetical protein
MKSISASLVVLSGAVLVIAGVARSDAPGDFNDIAMMLGAGTLFIGLMAWGMTLFKKD